MPKCTKGHEIKVMRSYAGYYLGTSAPEDGCPYCRVSSNYAKTEELARTTLTPDRQWCSENAFCNKGCGCIPK